MAPLVVALLASVSVLGLPAAPVAAHPDHHQPSSQGHGNGPDQEHEHGH